MGLRTDEEGILHVIGSYDGQTFDEILAFLRFNDVEGIGEKDANAEAKLRQVLSVMEKKGLIENRFFLDGKSDYALENAGHKLLKMNSRDNQLDKKWRFLD